MKCQNLCAIFLLSFMILNCITTSHVKMEPGTDSSLLSENVWKVSHHYETSSQLQPLCWTNSSMYMYKCTLHTSVILTVCSAVPGGAEAAEIPAAVEGFAAGGSRRQSREWVPMSCCTAGEEVHGSSKCHNSAHQILQWSSFCSHLALASLCTRRFAHFRFSKRTSAVQTSVKALIPITVKNVPVQRSACKSPGCFSLCQIVVKLLNSESLFRCPTFWIIVVCLPGAWMVCHV